VACRHRVDRRIGLEQRHLLTLGRPPTPLPHRDQEQQHTQNDLDHLRPEAFLRDVLVFDRLVVPYPDPEVPGEWQRWRRPEPDKPSVSWNPGRLDQILKVVGTESEAGYNGARLAQRSMWSPCTWQNIKSNLDIAEMASGNPWYATALGIREGLPEVVEAVAAYGSEQAWRAEVKPESTQASRVQAEQQRDRAPNVTGGWKVGVMCCCLRCSRWPTSQPARPLPPRSTAYGSRAGALR
jgi:hypothetical protein